MKRQGHLWQHVTSFTNLLQSAARAARGKRDLANVANFLFDVEREVCDLQDELRNRTYRPGPYHTFEIYEPKRRLISASPFRDRVVHHALCWVLEHIFKPTFIDDSYACRRGKGTHAAVDRFTHFARRHRYVLKCDVSKFFPSIDHEILKSGVAHKIKDPDVLGLVNLIIDHSNPQEPTLRWFPGDDLSLLAELRQRCREFLADLRLQLHPHKSVISRVVDGTRFLGYRVFPDHRRLIPENVRRTRRRLRRMQAAFAQGELSAAKLRQRITSWIGHAQHANTYRLRQRLFAEMIFRRMVAHS